LLLCPFLVAADSSPPAAQHDVHDIRLALRVRRALAQDTELARFPVNVTVKQGVVTLWGQVPSEALASRAAQLARRIQGVFQVRRELEIGPVEPDRDETPRLPDATRISAPLGPARGNSRPRGVLAGNPHEDRTPPSALGDSAWIGPPITRKDPSAEAGPPAVLLAPQPLRKLEPLKDALDHLVRSDVRYARARAEVQNGVVTLSGNVSAMEHAMELAKRAAQLPGVKQVVVEGIRVTP
jgi:osmotically-inducible protein OsmY